MTRLRKALPALALAIATMTVVAVACADDATELEHGKNSYDAGRYAEGVERFQQMLDASSKTALTDPTLIDRARAYYAACLIALGRTTEANDQIEKIIRQDPFYTPDPVVFPGSFLDRFTDVKARMKGEIEGAARARAEVERAARQKQEKAREQQRAYVLSLERLAAEETIVTRHSRFIAAIPFGVGQFQNGQDGLGYAFLVTEVLAAGASVATHLIHDSLVADYANADRLHVDPQSESDRRLLVSMNLYSSAVFALLAVGGIVHAEITFVPEVREHRKRPMPAPPPVAPTVSLSGGGWAFGLNGRF